MAKPSVVIPVNELNPFDLPPVCVMTGQTEGVSFRPVKFSWLPTWARLLGLIRALFIKRVKGELPFSEEGYARWRRKKKTTIALGVAAAVSLVGYFLSEAAEVPLVGSLLFPGFFGFLFAAIIVNAVMPGVQCTRIDEGHITLQIPSHAAAEAIKAHLHSGRSRPPTATAQVA